MGRLINIACCLWDSNDLSRDFSKCYDEGWADKLYRGFARNLTQPFRFVCFTDRDRHFKEPVVSIVYPDMGKNGYGDCIRPFEINEAMIFCGLDTVIVGNCDALADYALNEKTIALPRDPYAPYRACNGVVLAPAGCRSVFDSWSGENDMEHMRKQPHVFLDDIFPGRVVSYKGHVMQHGLSDARIVYFHGIPKMQDLGHLDWVQRHWA